MSGVVVVSTVRLKPEHRDAVLEGLRRLAEQTRAEPGCLSYAVHEDVDDTRVLVVIERWDSQVALENHLLRPYVREIIGSAQHLLDGAPEPRVLRTILSGDAQDGS